MGGNRSPGSSPEYILYTSPHSFRLFWQLARRADSRARANAGSRIAARIPMIAITTSSSISVKPFLREGTIIRTPFLVMKTLKNTERPTSSKS